MTVDDIIEKLGLQPHPEGGFFRRTYVNSRRVEGRGYASSIYFLLRGEGGFSSWHTTDGDELWLWHAGSPVKIETSADGVEQDSFILGMDLAAGEEPQRLVKAGCWQRGHALGEWSLVSCCVSPEFLFSGFVLAPDDWEPGFGPP